MLTDDLYVHERQKDQIDFSLSYFNFMPESLSFKKSSAHYLKLFCVAR